MTKKKLKNLITEEPEELTNEELLAIEEERREAEKEVVEKEEVPEKSLL